MVVTKGKGDKTDHLGRHREKRSKKACGGEKRSMIG